ncbi:MAG: diacylglycerol kinase family lipid kinase [Bacteroidales bacterium]|nr:diacylglycerol kinase family lipid kinase [Bacteroidales bacterium]
MGQTNQTKWAFIVNPVAGNGISLLAEQELKKQLEKRNINAEIVHTQEHGHASILAKDLADKGFTPIVAIGGDGTLNEMAKVLIDYPQVTMGIIPAGTGNDFAQILGMTTHFDEKDWDVFFETNAHALDVGRCNGNYFFNGMGLGFDAQVASENYDASGKLKESHRGNYIWHILKNLLFFKAQKMMLKTNGESKEKVYFMQTIAIGRRFAGDFFLTPKAIANDGLLDICMVDKLNLFPRLSILLKVPKGAHLSHPKVHYYQTEKLHIELDRKTAYHLDGELFFDSQFDIDILPKKINFIYKPEGNHFFTGE